MPEIEPIAVLAAAAAAFLAAGAYYAAMGDRLVAAGGGGGSSRMPPWKLAVEVGRCLLLAVVVAGLAAQGEVDSAAGGLLLGLALWAGFPLVLWTGAVVHEGTPPGLAAIHAGDWLVKLPLVAAIVGVLQ